MKRRIARRNYRPCLESLESRDLMAGNIAVRQTGRTLTIRGDAQANDISITQTGRQSFTIVGNNATLVNGLQFASFNRVRDFTINTRGGDDVVNFGSNSSGRSVVRNLRINTSNGADTVNLNNVRVTAPARISAGSGGQTDVDLLTLGRVIFRNTAVLSPGGGNDIVNMNRVKGNQSIKLQLKNGDDQATLKNVNGPNTVVNGQNGNDTVTVGTNSAKGYVTVYGGAGDDVLTGGKGFQVLIGGLGNDIIDGKGGTDILMGSGGNDYINDVQGNNYLFGGTGNDVLTSGGGNDVVSGGLEGGYINASGDFSVTFNFKNHDNGAIDGSDIISDAGGSANVLLGGNFQGNLPGSVANDDGDDYIYFNSLSPLDTALLFGQSGNDQLFGGAGNDNLIGGIGNDFLWGGDGDDTLVDGGSGEVSPGQSGDDSLYGGAGNDTLISTDGTNAMWGGTGNDTINGGTGNDRIYGGRTYNNGIFTLNYDLGTVDGDDMITDAGGTDLIFGGNDNAGWGANGIGDGNDTITDNGGDNDRLYGGNSNYQSVGNDGNDTVTDNGGTGDELYGGNANNSAGTDFGIGDDGDDNLNCADGVGGDSVYGDNDNRGAGKPSGEGSDVSVIDFGIDTSSLGSRSV